MPCGVCVDFGCGTGTSTRQLARLFPKASSIIGIDLSPYMIAVVPTGSMAWVERFSADERIELRYGDVTDTQIQSNSVDYVNMYIFPATRASSYNH
jgi:ubiquinone/menaquinone biosynthesis C-methylase UbiE